MSGDSVDGLRSKIEGYMDQAFKDLEQMVCFKSVFVPPGESNDDCDKMVDWLCKTFSSLEFSDVTAHLTCDGSKAVTGCKQGPKGAPVVLLYFHHDVQPVPDESAWTTNPWVLTNVDGRWYGRGAADCKGNIAVHLTAIRALGAELPITIKIIGEGSEEQGTGGLESFVPKHPELLAADVILVMDSGNFSAGTPSLTTSLRGLIDVDVTVKTLQAPVHSGEFGGAAPDALAALIAMLATLRDERGSTTLRGLDNQGKWTGQDYPPDQFREAAGVLDGVDLLGDGAVADMLWSRVAATVIGIDCPSVQNSTPAIQGSAKARVNVRVPPGIDPDHVYELVTKQLQDAAPWHVEVSFQKTASGGAFESTESGSIHDMLVGAMRDAYAASVVSIGQGGSIPLCNVFRHTFPNTSIMVLGVEEPKANIHAPNENVERSEVENMALAEALFFQRLSG